MVGRRFSRAALRAALVSSLLSIAFAATASAQSAAIGGHVRLGSNKIAGVRVTLIGVGTQTTGRSGAFLFENLVSGREYELRVSKSNYQFDSIDVIAKRPRAVVVIRGKCSSRAVEIDGECWPEDPARRDRDGDGLSDQEESELRTDPTDADSDGDDVADGQEVTDGTSPTDRGSLMPVLENELCVEWNGFLGGMFNVLEHVNKSRSALFVHSILFDNAGQGRSATFFEIPRGAQFDLLVHGMAGRDVNAVGRVCSTHEGQPGDLDGRMLYYRPVPGTALAENRYEFALALPFTNPIRGAQFVPFNTFQPSLDPLHVLHFVANWIQLINASTREQSGRLVFYEIDGSILASERVVLAPNARVDFAAHRFGQQKAGLVGWHPDRSDGRFQMRNVRYFYANQGDADAFHTAFQLEGAVGTGELIAAPIDTRNGTAVVELANTLNVPITASVKIYAATGVLLSALDISLAPYASYHLIADGILGANLGTVVVDGSHRGSVLATVMQYGRTPSLGLAHLYGIRAGEALGSELRSSYNTYLGQGCRLTLSNATALQQGFSVRLTRSDGRGVRGLDGGDNPPPDYIRLGRTVVLPPFGAADFDLCVNDAKDQYGVVSVQADKDNAITGTVIRVGAGSKYRFPTPLRQ